MKIAPKKITIAVLAAAAALSHSVVPAISYDVTPGSLLTLLQGRVEAHDYDSVHAYFVRMRAIGLTKFLFGDFELTLDQLEQLLLHPTPETQALLKRIIVAVQDGDVSFVVGSRVINVIASERLDAFPTGSAG
jgi:hypothetical protein